MPHGGSIYNKAKQEVTRVLPSYGTVLYLVTAPAAMCDCRTGTSGHARIQCAMRRRQHRICECVSPIQPTIHPYIGLKQGRYRGQAGPRVHSCFGETDLLLWLLVAIGAVNLNDSFILCLPLLANYTVSNIDIVINMLRFSVSKEDFI